MPACPPVNGAEPATVKPQGQHPTTQRLPAEGCRSAHSSAAGPRPASCRGAGDGPAGAPPAPPFPVSMAGSIGTDRVRASQALGPEINPGFGGDTEAQTTGPVFDRDFRASEPVCYFDSMKNMQTRWLTTAQTRWRA